MTENASLEDFLGDAGSGTTERSARDGADGRAASVEPETAPPEGDDANASDDESVNEARRAVSDADNREEDPSTPTYGWGRYDCSACGRRVERVWREDGRFVCGGCKSW